MSEQVKQSALTALFTVGIIIAIIGIYFGGKYAYEKYQIAEAAAQAQAQIVSDCHDWQQEQSTRIAKAKITFATMVEPTPTPVPSIKPVPGGQLPQSLAESDAETGYSDDYMNQMRAYNDAKGALLPTQYEQNCASLVGPSTTP